MRFSAAKKHSVQKIKKTATGAEIFARVESKSSREERRGGILLVGGNGPHDFEIQKAQAGLRLDRMSSYWSHAALILDWPDKAPLTEVVGAEVTLSPADPGAQVPERNGVTLFTLDRYADRDRYPNLAFGALKGVTRKGLKDDLVSAALNPNRDRLRYRFWEWLGEWSAYVYAPDAHENPIAAGIPLPGAAFCEYAYEAAGLDLTPGASAPNACPEILWGTLLYWYERMGLGSGKISAWSGARVAPGRKSLGIDLTKDFANRAMKKRAK